ncbi:MAG: hypothetical protein ACTHKM_04550 [Tsuneonella sp.]
MRAVFPTILLVLLAACGSQADKELAAIKSARSVLSEWALVEDQAEAGNAPAAYAEQMRQAAKDQLKTASEGVSGEPQAARLIDRIRAGSPKAAALKQAACALQPLEKRLEAA